MFRGSRHWRNAAAGLAIVTMLSGCGGAAATPAPTDAPTPTAGLFVDAGSDRGPISPLVYGSNYGPWLSVPFDLRSKVADLKLTTLTFPGGNWGDENDITTDQLDQFVDFCKMIGAAPRVVVRLKNGTPAAAADLVKYANVTNKYGIKYWGIGNETDLFEANGLTGYTAEQYNTDWRTFAKAMKAVDPSILLVGPDVSQFVAPPTGDYLQFRYNWLSSFLKANGDMTDMVSIHRYPYPVDVQTPPSVTDLQVGGKEWDTFIPELRKLIKADSGRDIPIAVTEINSSWATNGGTDSSMDSHMNAIWFADVLGHLIYQKVEMVDQFALASAWGILGQSSVNPMYYDYVMYQKFGTELVRSASDDPLVNVYAAKRADGTLTILIVNLGQSAATKPLSIVGGGSGKSAETWLFDKDHQAVQVDATPISAGGNVTLPGESVTVLIVAK